MGGGGGWVVFFFFKQKTAYEIYQCDWSSDVCSSDLLRDKFDETLIHFIRRKDRKYLRAIVRSEKNKGILVISAFFDMRLIRKFNRDKV